MGGREKKFLRDQKVKSARGPTARKKKEGDAARLDRYYFLNKRKMRPEAENHLPEGGKGKTNECHNVRLKRGEKGGRAIIYGAKKKKKEEEHGPDAE